MLTAMLQLRFKEGLLGFASGLSAMGCFWGADQIRHVHAATSKVYGQVAWFDIGARGCANLIILISYMT